MIPILFLLDGKTFRRNISIGSVTFEVKGWQEPRIEEAKNELIKVLTPKLEELKQDPEKNRYSIEFIQHQTIDFQLTGK